MSDLLDSSCSLLQRRNESIAAERDRCPEPPPIEGQRCSRHRPTHTPLPPGMILARNESVNEVRPEHSGPTNSLTAPIGKPPRRTASTSSTPVAATGRIIFGAGVRAAGIFCASADSIYSRIAEADCMKVYLRFIFSYYGWRDSPKAAVCVLSIEWAQHYA